MWETARREITCFSSTKYKGKNPKEGLYKLRGLKNISQKKKKRERECQVSITVWDLDTNSNKGSQQKSNN